MDEEKKHRGEKGHRAVKRCPARRMLRFTAECGNLSFSVRAELAAGGRVCR